jgi:hypothetical protein
MKAVGNGRENTQITFVFIFLDGNGSEIGIARSGNRNRIHGKSKSKKFDRKHVDSGQESIYKSGTSHMTTSNTWLDTRNATMIIASMNNIDISYMTKFNDIDK